MYSVNPSSPNSKYDNCLKQYVTELQNLHNISRQNPIHTREQCQHVTSEMSSHAQVHTSCDITKPSSYFITKSIKFAQWKYFTHIFWNWFAHEK